MFDDLEDGAHLGWWAAGAIALLLLMGLVGSWWVHQHRAKAPARVALQTAPAPVSRELPGRMPAPGTTSPAARAEVVTR